MTLPFDKLNDRIFYACQAVFFKERNALTQIVDPTDSEYLTGVQSLGTSSDISARSLLDVGRFQRGRVLYNKPSHEITIERVLDASSKPFYYVLEADYNANRTHILHANNLGCQGFPDNNLKSLRNYDITILYTPDRFNYMGSGSAGLDLDKDDVISITYTNCLINSLSYNIGLDRITESITLSTRNLRYNNGYSTLSSYNIPNFPESGKILKRNNFDLLKKTGSESILPLEVKEIFDYDNAVIESEKKILGVQSVSINIDIAYNELQDVGNWRGSEDQKEYEQNKWTYVSLPINVTCDITGVAKQTLPLYNFLTGNENKFRNVDNVFSSALADGTNVNWQTQDKEIKLVAREFDSSEPAVENKFIWDLGNKNYLTNIGYSGGDTGGGNVEVTLSYTNAESDIIIAKLPITP